MASASSTSARSLFAESKIRLSDRVQVNVNNIASLARQLQRASNSSEVIIHSAKNFALQEHGWETAAANLKKASLITTQLEYRIIEVDRTVELLEEIMDQVCAMQQ
ncbi:BLOC-1-related complex subunit 7 [Prorops nasuta]|uniref:BLOC-1-related complex subunit 7 n=1 Tax=Prorops nasuta TaxID=863751 RepID=UPI0034CEE841